MVLTAVLVLLVLLVVIGVKLVAVVDDGFEAVVDGEGDRV